MQEFIQLFLVPPTRSIFIRFLWIIIMQGAIFWAEKKSTWCDVPNNFPLEGIKSGLFRH